MHERDKGERDKEDQLHSFQMTVMKEVQRVKRGGESMSVGINWALGGAALSLGREVLEARSLPVDQQAALFQEAASKVLTDCGVTDVYVVVDVKDNQYGQRWVPNFLLRRNGLG